MLYRLAYLELRFAHTERLARPLTVRQEAVTESLPGHLAHHFPDPPQVLQVSLPVPLQAPHVMFLEYHFPVPPQDVHVVLPEPLQVLQAAIRSLLDLERASTRIPFA